MRAHAFAAMTLCLAITGACSSFSEDKTAPIADGGAPEAGISRPDGGTEAGSKLCTGAECAPTPLASGLGPVYQLVLDGDFVYFGTSSDPGSIGRIPKTGGNSVQLSSGQSNSGQLAIAGNLLYFASNVGTYYVAKDGVGGPTQLDPTPETGVAVDDTNVYVCRQDLAAAKDVLQIARATGTVTVLHKTLDNCESLIVANRDLFYGGGSSLNHASIDTADSGKVIGQFAARHLAIDADYIYSISFLGPGVNRTPRDDLSGKFDTIATNPNNEASGSGDIAVDDTYVYWTVAALGSTNGKIYRVSKGGGTPEKLVDGMNLPVGIALDDDNIYWSESTTGRIWKRRK